MRAAAGVFLLILFAGPRMQLLVNPRVCIAPCLVTATVMIEGPGPSWYCPKVAFSWTEGHASSMESECQPFDELSDRERSWVSRSRQWTYGRGDQVVSVVVAQGKNKAFMSRNVIVR